MGRQTVFIRYMDIMQRYSSLMHIALCSWTRHFPTIVPLSTQVYKWVMVEEMLRETLGKTSIPSRGSRNTPSCFMLQRLG